MILVLLFLALTVITLFIGVGSMAIGDKIPEKFRARLMVMRVVFQGAAILILLLLFVMSGGA